MFISSTGNLCYTTPTSPSPPFVQRFSDKAFLVIKGSIIDSMSNMK